ncbi:MAG TPA: type IV toxin-antitoxin system AbiEi family antitoxin domain-containing protein [Thermoleophilaceae bacterium]|nr:type IV toxin-antitoxin system AbiEi family antitoxin domain-containing protein [Thermoleophilaceae bacterium]
MATSEKGVVTRQELLAAGLTRDQIRTRLRRGSLLVQFPGVYRVGHAAQSTEATYLAAVKACGPRALLCGRAAAYLWRTVKGKPPPPEVLVPSVRLVPGVIARRCRRIHPRDRAFCHGIPVTTVARTIVDLAAVLDLEQLARACHEAGVVHDLAPRQVKAVLKRRPTAPGAAKLRLVMEGDAPATLSKLERRFLKLMRENGFPKPVVNRLAGGRRVDCRWAEHRLTVELDSYTFHRSRHAWELDRRRERAARARGDEFIRYTYGDVFETPAVVIRELSRILPRTSPPRAWRREPRPAPR